MSSRAWAVIAFVLALAVACCCLLLGLSGWLGYTLWQQPIVQTSVREAAATPTPMPAPVVIRTPVPTQIIGVFEQLQSIVIPQRNLRDLAVRLKGVENPPVAVSDSAPDFQIGDQLEFWASNVDTHDHFRVTAVLRYATPHVYMWVQKNERLNEADLKALADRFEQTTYATNREFFGSEWTPGVDGDAHLYLLLAHGLGFSVAGYYSSADEYSRLVHEYSNEHEMFYINLDNAVLNSDFTGGVLAHEFQHMIHWHNDANEDTWMNEGSSELAAFLNGFDVGGFDFLFARNPDLQLTSWASQPGAAGPNYGAGFLFMLYFLDRFGEDATKALVADPANGLTAVSEVLAKLDVTDQATGQVLTADDVFADWTVANYLADTSAGDGRYGYHRYPSVPKVTDTEAQRVCPVAPVQRTVHQYGADYIDLACPGQLTVTFTGSQQVDIVPSSAHSGKYMLWSNRADDSDMTATRAFDFTDASGSLTLSYWAWWEIEDAFDYVYVEVSPDGGIHWTTLRTPGGTDEDPNGNNFGWGYTDVSGGAKPPQWVEEKVDLSQYAGQKVLLRFEYVTDDAINENGFLLDDVSLPEVGYQEGFENGPGGWDLAGWARIDNVLPQFFRVQLIEFGRSSDSQAVRVMPFPLQTDQTGSLDLTLGEDVSHTVLVVSGITSITHQVASYEYEVKTR